MKSPPRPSWVDRMWWWSLALLAAWWAGGAVHTVATRSGPAAAAAAVVVGLGLAVVTVRLVGRVLAWTDRDPGGDPP